MKRRGSICNVQLKRESSDQLEKNRRSSNFSARVVSPEKVNEIAVSREADSDSSAGGDLSQNSDDEFMIKGGKSRSF